MLYTMFWNNVSRKSHKYCCCTVPMRNWNTTNCHRYSIIFPISCTVPMRNWNELVLFFSVWKFFVVLYLWGIETQWEMKRTELPWLLRCTVPMRNWNGFHQPSYTENFCFQVVPYLWGIENFCIAYVNNNSLRCTISMNNLYVRNETSGYIYFEQ